MRTPRWMAPSGSTPLVSSPSTAPSTSYRPSFVGSRFPLPWGQPEYAFPLGEALSALPSVGPTRASSGWEGAQPVAWPGVSTSSSTLTPSRRANVTTHAMSVRLYRSFSLVDAAASSGWAEVASWKAWVSVRCQCRTLYRSRPSSRTVRSSASTGRKWCAVSRMNPLYAKRGLSLRLSTGSTGRGLLPSSGGCCCRREASARRPCRRPRTVAACSETCAAPLAASAATLRL